MNILRNQHNQRKNCYKHNKNNHVPASRHAKRCQPGFGRIRVRTCAAVGWVDGKSVLRNVHGQTAQPEPCCCLPYPRSPECQKALRGIRNKQPFCLDKIQHKERSGRAEQKPDSPVLPHCLISSRGPQTRHILRLTLTKTPKRIFEGLGHGENPEKCSALFKMIFRELQEGRGDKKVKINYFKWSS